MARIDNKGPRSVKTTSPEPKPAPQPQAAPEKPAAKSGTSQTKQKADGFERGSTEQKPAKAGKTPPERLTENFNSGGRNEIKQLNKAKNAVVTTNKDGSETRTRESTSNKGKTTKKAELTTADGPLGEAKLKYTHTSTTGNRETKNTYTSQSDLFGRTTSSRQRDVTVTKGDTAVTTSTTDATDRWGGKKKTEGETTKVSQGENSQSQSKSVTTDARGNKSTVEETKNVTKDGKTTVTQGTKQTTGTERTTASTSKFEEGKYTLGEQVDWKDNKFNKEKSYNKEIEVKPSTEDKGFSQKQKDDKLGKVQTAGNLLGAAGAKYTITKGEVPKDKLEEVNLSTDPTVFRGSRVGYSGKHEVTVGADGVNASFKREAQAGLYAEKKDSVKGKYGEASYEAGAKVEAKASVDAKGKLDLNGLDASVNAKVGVGAEASIGGKAETQKVKVAGVDVSASVEGKAKVSVEASAEATGKVKVTRNPPAAIAEGTVGASAVAKIEGEVKVSGGPFAVKASAYGSAGAEAKATGTIGYEDGKIKIGGSVGAALGLGAGGAVNVEVDVKQIGDMAKNTAVKVADANGDGKLGFDDAKAAVNNTKKKVLGWLGF